MKPPADSTPSFSSEFRVTVLSSSDAPARRRWGAAEIVIAVSVAIILFAAALVVYALAS